MATSKTSKARKTSKSAKGSKKKPRRAFEGRQALIPGVKPRKAPASTTSAGELASGDPSRMTIVTVQATVAEVTRWRAAAMAENEKPHASAFCARAATAAADRILGGGR